MALVAGSMVCVALACGCTDIGHDDEKLPAAQRPLGLQAVAEVPDDEVSPEKRPGYRCDPRPP